MNRKKHSPIVEKQSVLNAIAFQLDMGQTNTAAALSLTRNDVFSAINGDRTDPNYVILMTDGFSNIDSQNVRIAYKPHTKFQLLL